MSLQKRNRIRLLYKKQNQATYYNDHKKYRNCKIK